MPVVAGNFSPSYNSCVGYLPSRGLISINGASAVQAASAAPQVLLPVTTKSTARSLLKSVRIADDVFPLPPSPVGSVHSVNVLLPLLRHSTFGAPPLASGSPVRNKSR